MADSKISALSELSIPDFNDDLYVVDDTGPTSYKCGLDRVHGILNNVCQGRLTLTSGLAVTTADVTAAANIYFTPCNGQCVSLYDGTRWRMYTFTELTLALGTLFSAMAYDIFLYDNAGTLTLETAEWANATITMTSANPGVVTWTAHGMSTGDSITFTTTGSLPTAVVANTQYFINSTGANTFNLSTSLTNLGAGTYINTSAGAQSGTHTGHQPQDRQTALTLQNGVHVKTGATTRRYLGSFMTTASTTTEDSKTKRFLWNLYNQMHRPILVQDATNSWTYSTTSYRIANAAAGNCAAIINGLAGTLLDLSINGRVSSSTATVRTAYVGCGENSVIATLNAGCRGGLVATSSIQPPYLYRLNHYPAVGYNTYNWLEKGAGTDTQTWYGDNGATDEQSGISGFILG